VPNRSKAHSAQCRSFSDPRETVRWKSARADSDGERFHGRLSAEARIRVPTETLDPDHVFRCGSNAGKESSRMTRWHCPTDHGVHPAIVHRRDFRARPASEDRTSAISAAITSQAYEWYVNPAPSGVCAPFRC
jgi:hypothetical protein